MAMKRVLIADDEEDIREIIHFNLTREGYDVHLASNGAEALDLANKLSPDLVILDINMPRWNGWQVCQTLRSQAKFNNIHIVFLSALGDDHSQMKGLEIGGDDFIKKPISPGLLVSRVNAIFRRIIKESESTFIKIDDLVIDPTKFSVTKSGEELLLAKKEFVLLYLLCSKPGRVFLRNEILSQIWGKDVIVGDRTIDVHIRKIRLKLGKAAEESIVTVKGVGYKYETGMVPFSL